MLLAASARSEDAVSPDAMGVSSECVSEEPSENGLNAAFSDYDGYVIAGIRIQRIAVFDTSDPKEDTAIYRFMNRLHYNTRPNVIKGQLLFREKDILKSSQLAESERILRAKPYLGKARIHVDQVCGNEVALLVITQDIWTTEPQFTLGLEGGNTKQGFSLFEGNVAGTGNAFSLGFRKDEDRESILYDFYSPHLFNSHLSARLRYSDNSDGEVKSLELLYPFFSLQTPWGAGFTSNDETLEEVIRYRNEDINIYQHKNEHHEIFGGWAFYRHAAATHRILGGITQQRHLYRSLEETTQSIPTDYNIVYPWLEYQYIQNRFAELTNIDHLHQVEDVATGKDWRLRIGYGGSVLGNDDDAVVLESEFSDWLRINPQHLVRVGTEVTGRIYTGPGLDDEMLWGAEVGYFYLMGDRHRWYVAARYDRGYNLQQHNQMASDDLFGLRGYPLDYQRGDKRYLVSVEKRQVSNLHLFNLFRLGTVIYLDTGRVWGAGFSDSNHLSNVGVGLRMSSSKARIGNVIHFDLAFPLADKNRVDEYQWVIKSSNRF